MLLAAGAAWLKPFTLRDGERSSRTFGVRRRLDFYPKTLKSEVINILDCSFQKEYKSLQR
jgi:hypothetical protein